MGMTARVYQITPNAFAAIKRGDLDDFESEFSTARVDLDKTWHAIHYLLTGSSEATFLSGGVQIPGISEHFEAHSPKTVSDLSRQVEGASALTFLVTYDPADFNAKEIFPGQWDEIGPDYIGPCLEQFLAVVREAADVGDGIAILIV